MKEIYFIFYILYLGYATHAASPPPARLSLAQCMRGVHDTQPSRHCPHHQFPGTVPTSVRAPTLALPLYYRLRGGTGCV